MDAVEEVVDWKEVKCLRSERKLSIQLWTESGMGIWAIFDMRGGVFDSIEGFAEIKCDDVDIGMVFEKIKN